jgi:hypothetical protein
VARLISAREWNALAAQAESVRRQAAEIRAVSRELRAGEFRSKLLARRHRMRAAADDELNGPPRS